MNTSDTLMALAELAQDPAHRVPSPCVSVCRMNPDDGLCSGCLRSIDEIIAWGSLDEPSKRRVWESIVARAALRPA
jgi:hypothetical protein